MAYTLDTTIGTILNNPEAKNVLEKYAPGSTTNQLLGLIKGMSLRMALELPQAKQMGITAEKVETVLAEINKIVK